MSTSVKGYANCKSELPGGGSARTAVDNYDNDWMRDRHTVQRNNVQITHDDTSD